MKVLITGGGGLLGQAVLAAAPDGHQPLCLARCELDVTDPAAVRDRLAADRPDAILNLAGFTAVDGAEHEPARAWAVNRDGPALLAREAALARARLVHISTDHVFSGDSDRPFRPDDPVSPLNVYGASKAAGERAVRAAGGDSLIVRTAWLHGPTGRNFLTSVLNQLRAGTTVRVVDDQTGSPTSVADLAIALWDLVASPANGIVHAVNAGAASRFEVAAGIVEFAVARGLAPPGTRPLAVRTSAFPGAARRPVYSALDGSSATPFLREPLVHWRPAIERAIDQVVDHVA